MSNLQCAKTKGGKNKSQLKLNATVVLRVVHTCFSFVHSGIAKKKQHKFLFDFMNGSAKKKSNFETKTNGLQVN